MENPMEDEQRRKIPMITWKGEEKKERKSPTHMYDRKGKTHDNKRREEAEKKEREWWPYDNGKDCVTVLIWFWPKLFYMECALSNIKTSRSSWGWMGEVIGTNVMRVSV